MRKLLVASAFCALMLGACVSTPDMSGSMGAPSLSALQSMCGSTAVDYGEDAQSVYSALFDAYVAQKRGGLSKDQFCAFEAGIASQHSAFTASRTTTAQTVWATFFANQRAQALSWRAAVDPTLRAG